jgi:hypothetical protein
MKKLTTIFLLLASTALMAQNIPNQCFDNWTSGVPTGWNSASYQVIPATVTQSGTFHGLCTSSVGLSQQQIAGTYFGGEVATGPTPGDPYYLYSGSNPVALNGYYQLTANGSDYFEATIITKNITGVNGGASFTSSTSTAVWKEFSVCITYTHNIPVDSISITLQLNTSNGHAGTTALVDDLSFGTCVNDVPTIDQNNVKLESAYPNPSSTVCNIIYTIPTDGIVSADLYDISGRKLETLLTEGKQTSGRYKLPVDVTSLANGIYIYRIIVDGQAFTQKFTVAR